VRTFIDSSAFAKRYVDEAGSQEVNDLCAQSTELALGVICIPEIISALNRRVRERVLSRRDYVKVKQRLSEDVYDATMITLTPTVISACTTVLEASPVRTLDALHIACALEWGAELFVSSDERQISAARRAGLKTRLV
jgi:predicted nucleic acid-binding protein